MKNITVNEIEKILDEALSDYIAGKIQNKNIIFVGHPGVGDSSKIANWFKKHSNEVSPCELTSCPMAEEENGVFKKLVKNGKVQYGFDDRSMEALTEEGRVCFCRRLNYNTQEQVQPFYEIFANRTYYLPLTDKEHDLSKLFLVIATAYPDNYDYHVADISEFEKCSDTYMVVPEVNEFKEYFRERCEKYMSHLEHAEAGKYKKQSEVFLKILTSDDFHFIFEKDEIFSPMNFIMLFDWCKRGNENDVLSVVPQIGCAGKRTFEMFKRIFDKIK